MINEEMDETSVSIKCSSCGADIAKSAMFVIDGKYLCGKCIGKPSKREE